MELKPNKYDLVQALQFLGTDLALKTAGEIAVEMSLDWSHEVAYVFKVIVNDPGRVPMNISGATEQLAVQEWVRRYKRGYDNRISQRISQPPKTVPDPIIEKIIAAKLGSASEASLRNITNAHRLAMAAENILGLLLEEYLALKLRQYGWHCAWGDTIRAVDFVNTQGLLLQIKNRSNSENSSSSAIRMNTQIKKWYRVKSSRIQYMWAELNSMCGSEGLSEADFVTFSENCIRQNPQCLAIEMDAAY